jgi:hypothetical protein
VAELTTSLSGTPRRAILCDYRPSPLEWLGGVLTVMAVVYYFWSAGITWRTILMTIAMLVVGYFMGNLARRAWFGY